MTEYLVKEQIEIYMRDAISLLLKYRRKNPNVVVNQFLADYFRCVSNGSHVLHRNYDFIKSTNYNRKCFIQVWWDCLQQISKSNELITVNEILSLTHLLFPDIPLSVIDFSFRFCAKDEEESILFEDFGYRFQFYFIYEDFVTQIINEFENMKMARKLLNTNETDKNSFSSMDWLRILNKFPQSSQQSICPDTLMMKQMVSNFGSLSLSEFFYHLVKSDFIAKDIDIVKTAPPTGRIISNLTENMDNNIERSNVNEKLSKNAVDAAAMMSNSKKVKSQSALSKSKSQMTNRRNKLTKIDSASSLTLKSNSLDLENGVSRRRKTYSQTRKLTKSDLIDDEDEDDGDDSSNTSSYDSNDN